jgi:hypothetical protein
MALMIDNAVKTSRLLDALKDAVPFTVQLVPSLVSYLRTQHIAIADQTEHTVSDLSYASDEGGIEEAGSELSLSLGCRMARANREPLRSPPVRFHDFRRNIRFATRRSCSLARASSIFLFQS